MTTFITLKKPKPQTEAELKLVENYEETLRKILVLNAKTKQPKVRKSKKEEEQSKIKNALVQQFNDMLKNAQEEVVGKRDNDGLIFGVDPLAQPESNQGAQGEQTTKVEEIFTEHDQLKTKEKERSKMETIVQVPWNDLEESKSEVKWSQSVLNRNSREGTRNKDLTISMPIPPGFKKHSTADIKSTTEINLIIQQRLGHASVDNLIGESQLRPGQIAQELIEEQMSKRVQAQKAAQKQKAKVTLPEKRMKTKKSKDRMETLKLPTVSPKDLLPSINRHASDQSKLKQASIFQTLTKSSLRKRPALQQDLHYGLLKYERQIQKPTQARSPGLFYSSLGSKGQYLADNPHVSDLQYSSAVTDLGKSVNAPSLGGWVAPAKKDGKRKEHKLVKKQSSTFYKRQEASRNQAHPSIKTGQISIPSVSRNASETKSRNNSVMDVTQNPLDINLTKNSKETQESEKSRKTTLSYMIDTGKLRELNIETGKFKEKPKKTPKQHPKLAVAKNQKRHQTQAELFAEFTGQDQIVAAQDKDDRYGRVVRDYQMLQQNKEKMRNLIGLLAQENDEVATVQRKLNLRPKVEESEMMMIKSNEIFEDLPRPPTTNDGEKMLYKSGDLMHPYNVNVTQTALGKGNNSVTVASTIMNKLDYNYKNMKITPLDFADEENLEKLKRNPSSNTIMHQGNFGYFIKNPHIHFGGNKNFESQSAHHYPNRLQLNNRPTSFDGPRNVQMTLFRNDSNNMFNSQFETPARQVSQLQVGKGANDNILHSADDRHLDQDQPLSSVDDFYQAIDYLAPPSVNGDTANQEDISFEPPRLKHDNIFALSSNVKIPKGRDMTDEPMILEENKFTSPKARHINLLDVKARVDSNNRGLAKNEYGHNIYQSPLTYVLMKGRVKSTFNYIVDNLHTYAQPLISHVQKQTPSTRKSIEGKLVENVKSGKKLLISPLKKSESAFSTLPFSVAHKLPLQLEKPLSDRRTVKTVESDDGKSEAKPRKKRKRGGKLERYKQKVQVKTTNEHGEEIIIELSEEEGSDKSEKDQAEETWQDMFKENEQLKLQIASQIAIFEQYIKVALLQQRQKEIEMRRGTLAYEKGIFEGTEVVMDLRKSPGFEDEDTIILNDLATEKLRLKQRSKDAETKFLSRKRRQLSADNQDEQSTSKKQKRRSMSSESDQGLFKQTPNAASALKTGDIQRYRTKGNGNLLKFFQIPVGGVIVKEPKLGQYGYNLQHDSHKTHEVWLDKIEALWKKLENTRHSECVQIQIQIEQNKKRLFDLTRQNVFELEVQTLDQKVLLRAKFNSQKIHEKVRQTKEERQLRKKQKKLRRAMARAQELDLYGLHNYVISMQLKCRMTEEVIDLAQKMQLKPDTTIETKLERMKRLRDQVFADLHYFITEREKVHWRNWDHLYMGNYKPEIPPRRNVLGWYRERCELTLLQIEYIELQSLQLQDEINGFNKLNSESIITVTDRFGHDQWLHFWQIRQLRRKQLKQVYAFDPSKLYLKSLEDPYGHIKYMQSQTAQNFNDQANQPSPVEQPEGAVVFNEGSIPEQVAENVHVMSLSGDEVDLPELLEEPMKISAQLSPIVGSQRTLSSDGTELSEEAKKEKFVPKWLMAIEKSKKEKEEKERKEKQARITRLQKLMDETEEMEIAEILDKHAVERKLNDYLGKINTHLEVELQLLDAWRHPDEIKESNQE